MDNLLLHTCCERSKNLELEVVKLQVGQLYSFAAQHQMPLNRMASHGGYILFRRECDRNISFDCNLKLFNS